MLTMQNINSILKENFQSQLKETNAKLPEDLASGYKNWVQALIAAAMQQENTKGAGNAQDATTESA